MKYQEKISVLVAVYNSETYLARCLDSLLMQSYDNLQIILVDDGSRDSSGKICDEYALRDSRIEVIHQDNRGLSGARNAGIDNSDGDYIVFVDADDELCPEMIEKMWKLLTEYDADISECHYFDMNNYTGIQPKKIDVNTFEEDEMYAQIFLRWAKTVVQWNKLFRKRIFDGLRFPEGVYHEDEYMIHHELSRCKRMVVTEERLYKYYPNNPDSLTSVKSMEKRYDAALGFIDRVDMFDRMGKEELAFLSFQRYFRYVLMTKRNYRHFHDHKEFISKVMKSDRKTKKRYRKYLLHISEDERRYDKYLDIMVGLERFFHRLILKDEGEL